MKSKILFCCLILFSLLIFSPNSKAQSECCVELEISGQDCFGCTAEGYEGILTPDMTDSDSWGSCDILAGGDSYSSGGYSVFAALNSGTSEGLLGTLENLVPGNTYSIGFEWQSPDVICSGMLTFGGFGVLIFGIDGDLEEYEYSGSGWDQVIICFEATGTTAEITITGFDPVEPVSLIIVDYLPCELVSDEENCSGCCSLLTEISDDAILCSDVILPIIADYSEETGSVVFEWFCDPEVGLDYLSDLNSLTPDFLFPDEGENDEQCFNYTLIIEDDLCQRIEEIKIIVSQSVIPIFDPISVCSHHSFEVLPFESDNDLSGTFDWDQTFEDYIDELVTINFIIDSNEENCIESYPIDIFVSESLEPEFSFEEEYCANVDELIELPAISDNGIVGNWTPEEFTPDLLNIGSYTFSFEVDEEYNCGLYYETTIEIIENEEVFFDLPDTLCINELPLTLPLKSENSFSGEWSFPILEAGDIDDDELISLFNNTDGDCTIEYEYTLTIIHPQVPSFSIDTLLCDGFDFYVPNAVSNSGVMGQWLPDTIFENMVLDNNVIITWHSLEISACSSEYSQEINIQSNEEYNFEIPDLFCNNELFTFPTQSIENNITGNWQLPSLSDFLDVGTNSNIFIPDSIFCADSLEVFFDILTVENPTFDLPNILCYYDDNLVLPINSNNNIEGSWNIDSIIVQSSLGQQIDLIFTPDNSCHLTYYTSIEISDEIIIDIIASPSDCSEMNGTIEIVSNNLDLEYSIDNGQTWFLNNIFENLGSASYTVLVREEGNQDCIESTDISVENIDIPEFQIDIQQISNCDNPNAEIEIQSSNLLDLEFSIDDGLTWTTTNLIDNLPSGDYILLVRLQERVDCIVSQAFTILPIPIIIIDEIILMDNSSCINNVGSILINTNSLVEFSIDDGLNWQPTGLFENLEEGNYNISLQIIDFENCIETIQVNIGGVLLPTITDIITIDLTSCNNNNGIIEIIANGSNLEYSIDNGMTWQSSNVFENLMSDTYDVIIQESDFPDCEVIDEVTIENLDAPRIELNEFTNPSACDLVNGIIELAFEATNIEYSIDNGINWQSELTFDNLAMGIYIIQARFISIPDCISELVVELELESELLMDFEIIISNPSSCDIDDGGFEIIIPNMENYLISIDNGMTFLDAFEFTNLEAGIYNINIVSTLTDLCNGEAEVSIVAPDCPCDDFDLSYNSVPASCNGEILGLINVELENDNSILWENGFDGNQIENLSEGYYAFEITYDNGNCVYVDSIYVEELDSIAFSLQTFPSDCEGLDNGSISVIDLSGGSGSYNYSLDNLNFQSTSGFYNLSPNMYQVYVQDLGGCVSFQQALIELSEMVDIDLDDILEIQQGESIILNSLINESSIDSFTWAVNDDIIIDADFILSVSPNQSQNYTLTVFYGDCVERRTVFINVISNNSIYLPNLISSDAQGRNNVFFAQGKLNQGVSLDSYSIFDRWGNLVFYKESPVLNNEEDGWDGLHPYQVVDGVYVYKVVYQINEQELISIGTITLIH